MKDKKNIYENKLKDETGRKGRISVSGIDFYQMLTLGRCWPDLSWRIYRGDRFVLFTDR